MISEKVSSIKPVQAVSRMVLFTDSTSKNAVVMGTVSRLLKKFSSVKLCCCWELHGLIGERFFPNFSMLRIHWWEAWTLVHPVRIRPYLVKVPKIQWFDDRIANHATKPWFEETLKKMTDDPAWNSVSFESLKKWMGRTGRNWFHVWVPVQT